MTALLVDDSALFVHHIVILEQALTYSEVVLLHLLLGILDAAGNHGMLDHLTFLKAQTVHHTGNTLAGKEAHQLILKRNKEDTATRVTLTSRTTTQLTIDAAAFMALSANDSQTAGSFHLGRELDVSTTTSHIGGNGHGAQHAFLGLNQVGNVARFALFFLGSLGLKT